MAYVASIWETSSLLDQCRQRMNSIESFFRTGTHYYKPYLVLQKTHNPFREHVNKLPKKERDKIAAFCLRFADNEAGIGAFYGYWVPEWLVKRVEKKVLNASARKRDLLEDWKNWMSNYVDIVEEDYWTYLNDAHETLDAQRVDWQVTMPNSVFRITKVITDRIRKLVPQLDGPDELNRYSRAFISADVPEIWEDAGAKEYFVESFCNTLVYASKAKSWSAAARYLLIALGFEFGKRRCYRGRRNQRSTGKSRKR